MSYSVRSSSISHSLVAPMSPFLLDEYRRQAHELRLIAACLPFSLHRKRLLERAGGLEARAKAEEERLSECILLEFERRGLITIAPTRTIYPAGGSPKG